MTGPIRDFGQSVLHSYFETGSGSSHSHRHILLLIAFLVDDFIIYIVISSINYKIVICINNNAAVNNNNLLKSPTSYIALQISRGQRQILFENYSQFRHSSSKRFASPGVQYGVQDITSLKSQAQQLNLTAHTLCIILNSN